MIAFREITEGDVKNGHYGSSYVSAGDFHSTDIHRQSW